MNSATGTTAFRAVFIVLSLLLSWRLWRFTIRPRLHPDEPKELPYWIPFIGHVSGFFIDFSSAIEKGRAYFAPLREPFTMTVVGKPIYIATSPEDIGRVWRNSKTISLNPITMDMYILGGISAKRRKEMFEPHPTARYNEGNKRPLTPTQMTIELHHQQLHTGPRLDSLMRDQMIPSILKKLDIADPSNRAVLVRSENSAVLSLLDFCIDTFITQQTEAYFGPELLQKSPDLIEAFIEWEYTNWKFLFMFPDILAQDMVKAKRTITGAFADYYRRPRSERPGAIYFVEALEDMLREVGLTEDEMGKFTLLHYWAVVGNLYKLTFWLISYLAHNQTLLEQIREEVLPAVKGEQVDEAYLLEKCPKLESLVSETLRISVMSSLAREILEPTVVRGKMLKPGNRIMLPTRELHFDPDIWGSSPETFNPDRFVHNSKLSKSLSYRPWGGGHTLCPGRFLARRSANALVAVMLTRYNVNVKSNIFPKGDRGRPSPGVVTVGRNEDLKIQLTLRG